MTPKSNGWGGIRIDTSSELRLASSVPHLPRKKDITYPDHRVPHKHRGAVAVRRRSDVVELRSPILREDGIQSIQPKNHHEIDVHQGVEGELQSQSEGVHYDYISSDILVENALAGSHLKNVRLAYESASIVRIAAEASPAKLNDTSNHVVETHHPDEWIECIDRGESDKESGCTLSDRTASSPSRRAADVDT